LDDTQGSIPPALAETPYEILRTPSLRSSVCPINPLLRGILCISSYEPSTLYIRQSAVLDRGYAGCCR
jgi:hypothetical protein